MRNDGGKAEKCNVAYPKSSIDDFAIVQANDVVVLDEAQELGLRFGREVRV